MMRFLIFNLVVGAALFYLLSDGSGPMSRPVEAARNAVSAAVDLAKSTAGPAPAPVAAKPEALTPLATEEAPRTPPAPAPLAELPAKRADAKRADGVSPPPAPRPDERPEPEAAEKTPEPVTAPEPKVVETRPAHAAPPPVRDLAAGKPAAIAKPVTSDPEALRRRAEVLTVPAPKPAAPKPAAPKPAAAPSRFAVKEGEALMTRDERIRELSRLADDMELVYFNSLGN